MKKNKKIIIIDPRSSIIQLIDQLRLEGYEVETLKSNKCDRDLASKRSDLSQIVFALSGSDFGLSIAQAINHQLGLMDDVEASILYNKINQYQWLVQHLPELTFDNTLIFDAEETLKEYLYSVDQPIVIRPAISYINGSAILYQGNYQAIEADIQNLFHSADKLITHPFIEGISYFINGVVFDGTLIITDAWECFNIKANQRYILTSVISLSRNETFVQQMAHRLANICPLFGMRFTPIHFEIVKSADQLKIVKMVPRLATEPLPTLCHLAGINSQTDALNHVLSFDKDTLLEQMGELKHRVADYSFVVQKAGYLNKTNLVQPLIDLPSYYQTYDLPAKGSYLVPTHCGASYGATILLKNDKEHQLREDIQFCQNLNDQDFFNLY